MSDQRLPQDASASLKGTIYQLYVAVQECLGMVSGQKVLVESCGDVTIEGFQQIETKHYQEPLTDVHPNFWRTLRNWMRDEFDETQYASLILYTTQSFGKQSRIAEWNEAMVEQRLAILEKVHKEGEERQAERQAGSKAQDKGIPDSLLLQRLVRHPDKQDKLRRVVKRFVIASRSPGVSDLYQRITDVHCKGILRGKQSDYLDALLGFVISHGANGPGAWEITYDQFTAKVRELTRQYCQGTMVFPTKHLGEVPPDLTAMETSGDQLFVQKLRDIEYHIVISEAVRDHFFASRTILHEFQAYEVSESQQRRYADEILRVFRSRYRVAARNASDILRDSQNFYDAVTAEPPPTFPGFESTPLSFRNGVIHMHTDAREHDLKWRLG